MIPFGERNECSKVVFSLMVLRIIMHFWCASSLLCLLSPCLSKVVQWFNVFRYWIPFVCFKGGVTLYTFTWQIESLFLDSILVHKPPKLFDHYKKNCLLPPCKASLPETILSAFIDIMLFPVWYLFRTDFWWTDSFATDFC